MIDKQIVSKVLNLIISIEKGEYKDQILQNVCKLFVKILRIDKNLREKTIEDKIIQTLISESKNPKKLKIRSVKLS